MPVQFVIGRAGSGKTHRCLTSIVDAMRADPFGPPIYWIVPKQATFMTERLLTCAIGAFCRTRIVSFDQLGEEIFAHAGGNVIPEVTPLGRQMVIGHLLRRLKPQLKFFASSAHQPGLAAELDAAFAEFERSGKNTADLATLIDEIETQRTRDLAADSLVKKLHDLRLIYDAYLAYLGQDRLDQHGRLQQTLACLDGCPTLRGATVYVDGFTQFTDHERRLLAGLAKTAAKIEIALLMDPQSELLNDPHILPADDDPFRQCEETYRRLWFTFHEDGVEIDEPIRLTKHREIADAAITFTVLHDRQAEVDAAARGIRKLWRDGFRLRDIAVLVRDIEPYHALIDASFREHGIAYFVDRRRSATHHPLLQFTRSFFRIVRFDWPNEDVLALLKSGLAGLSSPEADIVENYVCAHRIHGPAWAQREPWTYKRDLTRDADDGSRRETSSSAADQFRRRVTDNLIDTVRQLRSRDTFTVREIATALFSVLERFAVRDTLAGWAQAAVEEDDRQQAAEHEQVWAEFVDLCEHMVDLLGEESVTLADFVDVFESGLERFDLAITPPTVDQVLVGQVDRTRCPPDLRATFVLGLNEGEFPHIAREPAILTDTDRRELRRRRVDLGADRRQQLADEDLLGYIAFTRPSERLFVSRSLSDVNGKPTNPSRYWQRLAELFPSIEPVTISREASETLPYIDTPRQLIVSLLRWARSADPMSDRPRASLYQWLATRVDPASESARVRSLAWPAIGYTNDAALDPAIAADLFGESMQTTARQLETFAACPFKHFVRYGLGLSSPEAEGVTGLDLSQVYHRVLDIAVGEMLERRADWHRLQEIITPETIHTYAQAIGQSLREELMLSTARNQYLLGRVERTLGEIIATQDEMMRRGEFRPISSTVGFGPGRKIPALRVTTPAGRSASVCGSMDRVDVLADGAHAAVYDYKFSANALSLQEVYHGLSLQLLAYLLVLQANGDKLAGKPIAPVAALFLPLMRKLGDVDHPDEALDPADPKFHLRLKPRGILRTDHVESLDSELTTGRSDVVAAYRSKDGSFGYRGSTDVAEPAEFAAMLEFVERRIGRLVDEIVAGNVAVAPYRLNAQTPCPRCDYRSVCRFEPSINRYRNLQPMRREDALVQITAEARGDADGE